MIIQNCAVMFMTAVGITPLLMLVTVHIVVLRNVAGISSMLMTAAGITPLLMLATVHIVVLWIVPDINKFFEIKFMIST